MSSRHAGLPNATFLRGTHARHSARCGWRCSLKFFKRSGSYACGPCAIMAPGVTGPVPYGIPGGALGNPNGNAPQPRPRHRGLRLQDHGRHSTITGAAAIAAIAADLLQHCGPTCWTMLEHRPTCTKTRTRTRPTSSQLARISANASLKACMLALGPSLLSKHQQKSKRYQ